jgi:hypothetical protein
MESGEVSALIKNVSEFKKYITKEEALQLVQQLTLKFNIDISDIVKKVASHSADGFSLNRNCPYSHLYIGNGSENISIELKTLENETKIKVPKSFFV